MVGRSERPSSGEFVRVCGVEFPAVRVTGKDVLIWLVWTAQDCRHDSYGEIVVSDVAVRSPEAAERGEVQRHSSDQRELS